MVRLKEVLFVFFLGVLYAPGHTLVTAASKLAARDVFLVKHWDKLSGLPDETVTDIAQDSVGYLWIATTDGLCRFNGEEFYTLSRADGLGLEDDHLNVIEFDRNGDLWVGTQSKGVFVLRSGTFIRPSILTPLKGRVTTCIHHDSDGLVWIGTEDGLFCIEGERLKPFGEEVGLVCEVIRAVYVHSDGTLFVAHDEGVQWRLDGAGRFSKLSIPANVPHFDYVYSLSLYRNDRVTVSFNIPNAPSYRLLYSLENYRWRLLRDESVGHPLNRGSSVVGSSRLGFEIQPLIQGGIQLIKPEGGESIEFPRVFSASHLNDLFIDREENMWLGFNKQGLVQLSPRVVRVISGLTDRPTDNMWSVSGDGKGAVVVCGDGGISKLEGSEFRAVGSVDELGEASLRAAAIDGDGRIWTGSGHGLFYFEADKWMPFSLSDQGNEFKIRALHYDRRRNRLWVGHTGGVDQIQRKTIVRRWTTASGLKHSDIRAVLPTRDGSVWLGTNGDGVQVWNGSRFHRYTVEDGLGSNYVWGFDEDNSGRVWLATEGGLSCIDDSGVFNFGLQEGLHYEVVNDVLVDRSERVWVTTDQGVLLVDIEEFEKVRSGKQARIVGRVLDEADGFVDAEANGQRSQPAVWEASDGRVWVPTVRGMAVIDPDQLHEVDSRASIVIESVESFGTDLKIEKDDHGVSLVRVMPGGGMALLMTFDVVSFRSHPELRYSYRIESLADEWIELGTQNTVFLTNLGPGVYKLELRAMNSYQHSVEVPALVRIEVLPRFSETFWFKAIVAAFSLAVGMAVWGWRANVSRRLFELEKAESVSSTKEQIALDLHDRFGSELTKIMLTVDSLRKTLGNGADERSRFEALEEYTNRLSWRLRQSVWTIDPEKSTLESVLNQVSMELEEQVRFANIQLMTNLPNDGVDQPVWPAVQHELIAMTQEIGSNVAKHSDANTVRFSCQLSDGTLSLYFEDDGIGFDIETTSMGHGLPGLSTRAERISAKLSVDSSVGNGTRIALRVPLVIKNS